MTSVSDGRSITVGPEVTGEADLDQERSPPCGTYMGGYCSGSGGGSCLAGGVFPLSLWGASVLCCVYACDVLTSPGWTLQSKQLLGAACWYWCQGLCGTLWSSLWSVLEVDCLAFWQHGLEYAWWHTCNHWSLFCFSLQVIQEFLAPKVVPQRISLKIMSPDLQGLQVTVKWSVFWFEKSLTAYKEKLLQEGSWLGTSCRGNMCQCRCDMNLQIFLAI